MQEMRRGDLCRLPLRGAQACPDIPSAGVAGPVGPEATIAIGSFHLSVSDAFTFNSFFSLHIPTGPCARADTPGWADPPAAEFRETLNYGEF